MDPPDSSTPPQVGQAGVQGETVIGFDLPDGSGCDRSLVEGWTWFRTPEGLRYFFDQGTFQTAVSRSAPCAYHGSVIRLYPNSGNPHFHSVAVRPPVDWSPDIPFEIWFDATDYRVFSSTRLVIPGRGWTEVLVPFGPEAREVTISTVDEAYFDDLTYGRSIGNPASGAAPGG